MLKLVAVLAALTVTPPTDPCPTFAGLIASAPPGMVRGMSEPIAGTRALKLVAVWNALPPATAHEADEVQFLFLATGQTGIVLSRKGCVVAKALLSSETFSRLISALRGGI